MSELLHYGLSLLGSMSDPLSKHEIKGSVNGFPVLASQDLLKHLYTRGLRRFYQICGSSNIVSFTKPNALWNPLSYPQVLGSSLLMVLFLIYLQQFIVLFHKSSTVLLISSSFRIFLKIIIPYLLQNQDNSSDEAVLTSKLLTYP